MKYKLFTLQYGEFADVYEHKDLDALLHDLANISLMSTIEVIDIHENGKSLSRTRIKVLRSLAAE